MINIYIYGLLTICILLIGFGIYLFRIFSEDDTIRIGLIWYFILLELNFINMLVMVYSYKKSLLNHINKDISNKDVQKAISGSENGGITGTLFPWPMGLLANEDLSPNLAIRSIIPGTLWV